MGGGAESLHQRGVTALLARRFDTAGRLLTRARAAADAPDVTARIEASRAFLAYETGHPAEAFRLCLAALATTGLGTETKGIVECQHALLLLRSGRTGDSLEAFGAAIRYLVDPIELAKAHINRGGIYLQLGQADRAIADFERSVRHSKASQSVAEQAIAMHNLGYAHMLGGDLVSALACMDEAAPTVSALSPLLKATVEQDRAEVLLGAGMIREGQRSLRAAARTFGQRRMHQRRGEAELALARTLLQTDPGKALAAARSARQRFIRTGADGWRVRADGAVLAAEVDLGRAGPGLLARGDKLIAELESLGLEWGAASIRAHTARVLLRRGDLAEATARVGQVRLKPATPLSLRLLARDVRAEIAAAGRRRSAALDQVRAGLEELHAWQSSFGSLDLQTMVVGHGRRLASRGLTLAVESGSASVLYEWSERARMLASRIQPVRVPADDQMTADLAQLRKLTLTEDAARVPHPREALSAEIRTRVRERAWQLRGSAK